MWFCFPKKLLGCWVCREIASLFFAVVGLHSSVIRAIILCQTVYSQLVRYLVDSAMWLCYKENVSIIYENSYSQ